MQMEWIAVYFEVEMFCSLADPDGQLGGSRGSDGQRVRYGRHPAAFDAPAVDVERRHAAADADGDAVPLAVGQRVGERFETRRAAVRVQQADLIFTPATLQF